MKLYITYLLNTIFAKKYHKPLSSLSHKHLAQQWREGTLIMTHPRSGPKTEALSPNIYARRTLAYVSTAFLCFVLNKRPLADASIHPTAGAQSDKNTNCTNTGAQETIQAGVTWR